MRSIRALVPQGVVKAVCEPVAVSAGRTAITTPSSAFPTRWRAVSRAAGSVSPSSCPRRTRTRRSKSSWTRSSTSSTRRRPSRGTTPARSRSRSTMAARCGIGRRSIAAIPTGRSATPRSRLNSSRTAPSLGAEVIKIENHRDGGDVGRPGRPALLPGRRQPVLPDLQPQQEEHHARPQASRGQGGVPARWREDADAVLDNLRGDLPAKLGLTYEHLKEANPKIVCARTSPPTAARARARPGPATTT